MEKQPEGRSPVEALLDRFHQHGGCWTTADGILAAAELRRLHEENGNLKSGYQGACYACEPVAVENQQLRDRIAALEKALGVAVEALEDCLEDSVEVRGRFRYEYGPNYKPARQAEMERVIEAGQAALATARQTLGGAA